MGKRKKSSRGPIGPKKKDPLPTTFTCLFCNHEKAVTVKLDKKAGIGQLDCRICGQKFQCAVNYLSAAVDVYGEWVDAADAVAKGDNGGDERDTRFSASTSRQQMGRAVANSRDEDDDDGEDRRYEGEGIVADDDEL